MSKQFWGIIALIIIIFVGVFAFGGNKNTGSSAGATNHVEGSSPSNVKLVEYGDYECPYCGQYFPIVKQVQDEFKDKIVFQFRNFPLTSLHPNAFAGARAAEAAALQNKFWEMHDLLYQDQTQWSTATDPTPLFRTYAGQLGLNLTKFTTDYASSAVNDSINADMAAGSKLNITGTPTFFLDGKQVQVGESVADFEKIINAELSKKGSATSAGSTSQTKGTSTNSTSGQ